MAIAFKINGDSMAEFTPATLAFLHSVPPVMAADWCRDIAFDAENMRRAMLDKAWGKA